MNMQEITAEIERLQGIISDSAAKIGSLRIEADRMKPELRHGDYGYDIRGRPCIYMKHPEPTEWMFYVASADTSYGNASGAVAVPKVILGNIFDDLEAMQKDVDKVDINSLPWADISLMTRSRDDMILAQGSSTVNVSYKALPDLIRGLQQINATHKRKQG